MQGKNQVPYDPLVMTDSMKTTDFLILLGKIYLPIITAVGRKLRSHANSHLAKRFELLQLKLIHSKQRNMPIEPMEENDCALLTIL